MPLLVRGVAESQETGMTLIRALEKVVDNKMVSGPLAKEVKQMVVQMSWGTSFEDALTNFKNHIDSPIVNRFCVLVLEASRSGGTIKKVFTATSGFMEEMKEIDRDTSAQMKPYTIVIYAAFGVHSYCYSAGAGRSLRLWKVLRKSGAKLQWAAQAGLRISSTRT